MNKLYQELKWRGLIDQQTCENFEEILSKPTKVYCGFDPTSDCLHLGNLQGIIVLRWFQKFGHTPIALVGGATGMIGDPSGKSQERTLLDAHTLQNNVVAIQDLLKSLLLPEQGQPSPEFVNNYDWFKDISFINFLRDIGKLFRVNVMLTKESVKNRLSSEEGISFTEFSYQLLQAYDFVHLSQQGITIQLGGSDQWGNITAGCELNRKLQGTHLSGMTWPLITRSDGKKFGKSEDGAIWLRSDKLSAYQFYQYLIKIDDRDVISLIKRLTFLPKEKIQELEQQMLQPDYKPNTAQKIFAAELTQMIHGSQELEKVLASVEASRPGKSLNLTANEILIAAQSLPVTSAALNQVLNVKLVDLLAGFGFVESKAQARRLISGGGVYVNSVKISDEAYQLQHSDVIEDQWVVLSLGKKNKYILKIES